MKHPASRTAWLAAAVFVALAVFLAAQEPGYVGVDKCRVCHKTDNQGRQASIWEASAHAKSFADLATPKAADIAKSMGVTAPQEAAQCLGCHAPLAAKAPELKAEGVSCEVCHGPGSLYRKLSIMKDRAEAVKNGLILYPDKGAIQAQCLKCHQNAHGKTFDYEAAWAKIKHPVPGK